eukprot:TRINITY_DN20292_c0_g1_i2.p1 TRINITY_DN20292_c0_g1~~TRINITY_DN20292_c0_g1_i2.p1  ORF type:complete len:295 (-),score=8.14 TRINITY_DN20292_c0_g1_i2:108-992(-)
MSQPANDSVPLQRSNTSGCSQDLADMSFSGPVVTPKGATARRLSAFEIDNPFGAATTVRPMTTPRTPPRSYSPPPAPKNLAVCPLMRALRNDSVEKVVEALQDHGALERFFFDNHFEPVLCCAVRCGCRPEILTVLLRYGADVTQVNRWCQSPLETLVSADLQYPQAPHTVARDLGVARVLMQAGARPLAEDSQGRPAWAVARAKGRRSLAFYLQFYFEVQAVAVLRRARDSPYVSGSIAAVLSPDVLPTVIGFLVPMRTRVPSSDWPRYTWPTSYQDSLSLATTSSSSRPSDT